jgi:spore germination protein KB
MPEPGRISPAQLMMLIITTMAIWGHLVTVRMVFVHAGRDAWLSGLAGCAAGVVLVAVISLWLRRWPGQNLLTLVSTRLKWAGLPITVAYLGYFFLSACVTGRLFGLAFSIVMPETPEQATAALLLGLSAYALVTGLEPYSRTVQILLVILAFVATVFLVPGALKEMNFRDLQPIMVSGPVPVLRGALDVLTWVSDLSLILMLHPAVRNLRAPWTYVSLTLLVLVVMILGPLIGPPIIFGPEEAARMVLPTYDQIRYMRLGTFIENLDGIAIFLWTVGLYARMTLFHYLLALGTAQVLRLQDYRPLVVPLAVLIGVGTAIISRNNLDTYNYLLHSAPVISLFFGLALPALLLLTGLLLGWRGNASTPQKGASS